MIGSLRSFRAENLDLTTFKKSAWGEKEFGRRRFSRAFNLLGIRNLSIRSLTYAPLASHQTNCQKRVPSLTGNSSSTR